MTDNELDLRRKACKVRVRSADVEAAADAVSRCNALVKFEAAVRDFIEAAHKMGRRKND